VVREPDGSHSRSDASHRVPPCCVPAGQGRGRAASSQAHVEALLGWLEAHGCTRLEVSAVDGGAVGVRCVCPPRFWLGGAAKRSGCGSCEGPQARPRRCASTAYACSGHHGPSFFGLLTSRPTG
jgi:hypothetical protein